MRRTRKNLGRMNVGSCNEIMRKVSRQFDGLIFNKHIIVGGKHKKTPQSYLGHPERALLFRKCGGRVHGGHGGKKSDEKVCKSWRLLIFGQNLHPPFMFLCESIYHPKTHSSRFLKDVPVSEFCPIPSLALLGENCVEERFSNMKFCG